MQKRSAHPDGFTLIELTVVMLIIIILMGLVFTGAQGMIERAKKTQAKNDLTQIVTAVNAFYTEYGKYPIATSDTPLPSTADLFYSLRAVSLGANAPVNGVPAINPRGIVFISPRDLGTASNPRSGIGLDGQYYDPWGKNANPALTGSGVYHIQIDADYSNDLTSNPYGASGPGGQPLRQGVIAWSLGKDGGLGKVSASNPTGNNTFTGSDDVISWQ